MQNDKNTIAEFEEIYLSFYPRLKRFAQEYVINEADAEILFRMSSSICGKGGCLFRILSI